MFERCYGCPPGAESLVRLWNADLIATLTRLVWAAFDDLHGSFGLEWTQDFEDLERSISEQLERAIHKKMDPFLPVYVQHGPAERESRASAPAMPPTYDIAFCWTEDPRLMWPLEAKVIKSDSNTAANLGDYVKTVQERFLTCYYAPFSGSGAMLAYLKSGDAESVATAIALRLECNLVQYDRIPDRVHKVSTHQRVVPEGKDYPAMFRCHHLVLSLS